MNTMKRLIVFCLLTALIVIPWTVNAGQVIKHPRASDALVERWQWGIKEAASSQFKDGFWIGYSIKVLMGEYSYYVSTDENSFNGHIRFGTGWRGIPLDEILYGKNETLEPSGEEQVRIVAGEMLERMENPNKPEKKVWKDVAILLSYDFPGVKDKEPSSFWVSNLNVPFETKGLSIVWLGPSNDGGSLGILQEFYRKAESEHWKKRLISIMGLHSDSDLVVPILTGILKSRQSEDLRGRAASELGDHAHADALNILHSTAMEDGSLSVRKRAANGLEDMELEGAVDALVDIARNADQPDVRRAAINSLGDKASRRAAEELENIVYDDDDTEVQKRAVDALEDLPTELGIPVLIKVAKTHPKLPVRKRAIHCLGDSDDPRALATLIEILKK